MRKSIIGLVVEYIVAIEPTELKRRVILSTATLRVVKLALASAATYSPVECYGGCISQWLERLTADQQVPGSTPGAPFM